MSLSAGDRLGAYEIVASLNRGGQGDVWRARDTRLNRDVAVKVLRDDLASDPVARERFDREAKAVAALSHPNILDVHDVGSTDGTSWLVTELLEGETLKEKLEAGPLPWRRAVEITLAIADGLAAAHARGIIHRDIKPSNVFVTSDGRVKILDFGIAALTEETTVPAENRDLTAPQTLVGTAGYLAPEQIRREPLDARCDIWALGCVLYEMTTGRRAFPGDTPPESLVATLRGEPKDPADLIPDLPAELRRFVLRCLEKRPDRRFQTASDLAFALRLPFEPTSRPSPALVTSSETVVIPEPRRGTRWRGGLAALAAAVVVALAAWLFVPRRSAAMAERLAVLPFANETGDAANDYLCEGVTNSLIDAVARTPALPVLARATVYHYVRKHRDPEPVTAGHDLGVTKVLTGRVMRKGPDVVVDAELIDVASGSRLWGERVADREGDPVPAAAELAPKIALALRPSLTPEERRRFVGRQHNPGAWDRVLRGRFFLNRRGEAILKAKEYFEEAAALDPGEAEAYRGLAEVFHLMAYYGFAAPATLVPEQRKFATRALALDPSLSGPRAILADARYVFDHDWPGAEADFKSALALNPNDAEAHQWYSNFLTASSRFDEAFDEIERARKLDQLNPLVQMDIGLARYWGARDLRGAEKDLRGAMELDPSNFLPHLWVALPLLASNRTADALKELDRALELEPGVPATVALRGYTLAVSGRAADATAVRKELDALARERYVGGFAYAILALGEKKTAEALDGLEKAAADGEALLTYLEVERAFDPLRADPRFRALVKRLGIPPSRR